MFTALGAIFKTMIGCAKLSFGAIKLGFKMGKGLAKGGWRAFKAGRKLGKGVAKVVRTSRAISQKALQKGLIQKSHLFYKEGPNDKAKDADTNTDNSMSTSTKETQGNSEMPLKKSHIFIKED